MGWPEWREQGRGRRSQVLRVGGRCVHGGTCWQILSRRVTGSNFISSAPSSGCADEEGKGGPGRAVVAAGPGWEQRRAEENGIQMHFGGATRTYGCIGHRREGRRRQGRRRGFWPSLTHLLNLSTRPFLSWRFLQTPTLSLIPLLFLRPAPPLSLVACPSLPSPHSLSPSFFPVPLGPALSPTPLSTCALCVQGLSSKKGSPLARLLLTWLCLLMGASDDT